MDYLNVIVNSENIKDGDKELIFGEEDVIFISKDTSIFDLLVMIGVFSSKGQAKKNWNGAKELPNGYSEFYVGKLKRQLSIWNPTE